MASCLLMMATTSAHATPQLYNVELFDDLNVLRGTGSFGVDNVPPDPTASHFLHAQSGDFSLLSFSFDVLGVPYTLTDVFTFQLVADATGRVADWGFIALNQGVGFLQAQDIDNLPPSIGGTEWFAGNINERVSVGGNDTVITTVGEPATLSLLFLSLIGLVSRRRIR